MFMRREDSKYEGKRVPVFYGKNTDMEYRIWKAGKTIRETKKELLDSKGSLRSFFCGKSRLVSVHPCLAVYDIWIEEKYGEGFGKNYAE